MTREEAISILKVINTNMAKYYSIFDRDEAIDMAIEALQAEPKHEEWIPCSERLPKERDWYLGVFRESDTGWVNPIPFVCDYLLGTETKFTTKEGWILKGCTDREEYIDYYYNLECVAWMPLPKPYKGGDLE